MSSSRYAESLTCIYPLKRFLGDCLKLRAVPHPSLDHLVDCIVFTSVAKPKHHAAPAMNSGGDLDGMFIQVNVHQRLGANVDLR